MVSVKWMRMDTVAGLLTTALSRTYPPLVPPHIQELFQNPNGKKRMKKRDCPRDSGTRKSSEWDRAAKEETTNVVYSFGFF